MTPKGQNRDPIIFKAPYLDNGARQTGRQFPITTPTPVTISIILEWSQIDAGFLIQVLKNEKKTLRRIHEEIMRARSTLDWSQFNRA